MITISMDEGGTFERQTKDLCFIAGTVFDDQSDKNEAERERQRIKNFFRRVCRETGTRYPIDLHSHSQKNPAVAKTKECYRQKLGEFLINGTYDGQDVLSDDKKPRKGKYHVYAYVKSREGKKSQTGQHWSNLVNDNAMSNLFMHMATNALSAVLFYNKEFGQSQEISLDLPTRLFKAKHDQEMIAYENIGYKRHQNDGIRLVSEDFYRTFLEREMSGTPFKQKRIKRLQVRRMDHWGKEEEQEFLYLADAVCTYISYQVNYQTEPLYTEVIRERMSALCGHRHILFLYDDADTCFTQARDALERDELYHCLQNLYDATHGETEAAAFYNKVWEPQMRDLMEKKVNVRSFSQAVKELLQDTRSSHRDDSKLLYFFQRLEALAGHVRFQNPQEKAVMYDLYDAGASVYNHAGKTPEADQCSEMSKQYYKYVGIDRMFSIRNKKSVSLCDSFEYEKARELAKETVAAYEMIMEVQELFRVKEKKSLDYGKHLSQLGQCYAYLEDKQAEECFLDALSCMDPGTADYVITESYLLHYYAERNDREKYEKYAKEYFGNETSPENQMMMIARFAEHEVIRMKFASYVFLKGIYRFYADTLSAKQAEMIYHWESTMKEMNIATAGQWKGHPMLLIDKYIALIAAKRKKEGVANQYLEKIRKSEADGILAVIRNHAILTIRRLQGVPSGEDEALCRESVIEMFKKKKERMAELMGEEVSIAAIDKVVTYTFR